jgi:hypothetical protein
VYSSPRFLGVFLASAILALVTNLTTSIREGHRTLVWHETCHTKQWPCFVCLDFSSLFLLDFKRTRFFVLLPHPPHAFGGVAHAARGDDGPNRESEAAPSAGRATGSSSTRSPRAEFPEEFPRASYGTRARHASCARRLGRGTTQHRRGGGGGSLHRAERKERRTSDEDENNRTPHSTALGGTAHDNRERMTRNTQQTRQTVLFPHDRAATSDDGESPSDAPQKSHKNTRDTGNAIYSDEERRALDDMGRVRDEYERTEEKHAAGTINDALSTRPRR